MSFDFVKNLKTKIQFEGNYLYLTENIEFQGERYGAIYMVVSIEKLSRQTFQYLVFSAILLVVTFLTAGILGTRLSERLTGPILNLADTAGEISVEGDYSIRVKKTSNDEIGTLYDSFNDMLEQIAARDREIRQLNEGLEDKVEERTRDLLKAKEQAESAKLSAEMADRAKSTFLANMSHEIRTPMNAVLGYSNLLMKMVSQKKQQEYLDIIQNSGKNLLALINDILDLSKIESGKLSLVYKPMDPHRILNEIRNIFKIRTEEKGIDFIIEVAPGIPSGLLLDETRLRQILFNIVGNAVKFTHQGYVKLSAGRKASGKDTSRIDLVFKVEDSGIGIPGEQVETIFHAFEQQKDLAGRYGGTGLGLTITKRLVEIMNGTISVAGREAEGSVFSIELRDVEISSLHTEPGAVDMPMAEGVNFDGASVLLVEDNLYNLKLVRAMLEEKKIRVETAVDGKDALEKLTRFRPDVILMDMKMAGMDGYEATRIIKADEKLRHIPVVALTAAAMKEGRQKVKDAGCDGFLAKPIDERQLFAELVKYLHTKQDQARPEPAVKPAPTTGNAEDKKVGIDLSHLSPGELSEMVELLSGPLTAQWRQLRDSMLLDEWVQFGTKIRLLGEDYSTAFLEDYGRHIVENVEHLNIGELKKTIKNFPGVVETLQQSKKE
ncbi:MAG: response regulator [bacterium]|nr:response regulator [bacterium]